jgi:hypothetical protein
MMDDIDREQQVEESILKWNKLGRSLADIEPGMNRRMPPHAFGRLDTPASTID